MTTQAAATHKHHRRAVRFFWALLVGATVVSLVGNITHAVLPYIPHIVVQIGAAAVPPVALLAAVHGIALAVRAGASGRVYCWAVGAIATIGIGAFAVSFMTLRDLMQAIGYTSPTACIFPAIIDTAVAVATLMLVALGDKPARRARTGKASPGADSPSESGLPQRRGKSVKADVSGRTPGSRAVSASASIQPHPAPAEQGSAQAETARADADLALELIASGVTTQPAETVIAVLHAHCNGASINAAAKASGINYRTAQRIVEAVAGHGKRKLLAVG